MFRFATRPRRASLPVSSSSSPRSSRQPVEKLEDRTHFAASLPSGFQSADYVTGLPECTSMAFAPDGRIFYTEKSGAVRVVKNGQLLPTPLIKVVPDGYFERGLEGICLDPNFANNGVFYLYYVKRDNDNPNTAPNNAKARLSRFHIDPANPDRWDSTQGEDVVIDNIGSDTGYHNGGFMAFEQTGDVNSRLMYVGVGEAGLPRIADATNTAQDLTTLNGKILRINPREGAQLVPSDNPFVSTLGARPEIYAYGVRNPFSGNVKPGTNTIFFNDVGSNIAEEINQVARGANFGYPKSEGYTDDPAFTGPLLAYKREEFNSTQAAITGGVFYNGSMFPSSYQGKYFFADETNKFIRVFDPATPKQSQTFGVDIGRVLDLDVGPDGALYGLTHTVGDTSAKIIRVSYVGAGANRNPTAVAAADKTSGGLPLTVNFSAADSTDPDGDAMTYAWDFGDGSTGTGKTAAHTYTAGGKFSAVLTVSDGKGGSSAASPIVVTTNDSAPVVTITTPAANSPYSGGDTITYAATATDPEDGLIDPSKFDWTVILYHQEHTHPFLTDSIDGQPGGSFTIPRDLEVDPVQFFRIMLTVTDSSGVSTTSTTDILPRKSAFTLASNVQGLTLTLDGVDKPAGTSVIGVAGTRRRIEAPAEQTVGGVAYKFTGWSDGGDAVHDILTPDADTTYTAQYEPTVATPTSTPAPTITAQPSAVAVLQGRPAAFSVVASDAALYQWKRDGVDVAGANGPSYVTPPTMLEEDGVRYTVVVTNAGGSVTSSEVKLTVAQANGATLAIKSPRAGQTFTAGQAVKFKGAATDANGKKLPASAYSWQVELIHDATVDQAAVAPSSGKSSGSFKVSRDVDACDAGSFYRIHLTVTDPTTGLPLSTFQDVHPRTAAVTVMVSQPGLKVGINGTPSDVPLTFPAVVGAKLNLTADATQVVDGVNYSFQKWNAGRKPELSYTVGAKARTIEAMYVPASAT
jgi:glucose/arabinose dehydrogenase/PKD repeat protein